MTILSYRPLTPVKELIEELGFAISYPFDDLIFIDSNAFLVQFSDSKENTILIYFNNEIEKETEANLLEKILELAPKKNLEIEKKGKFSLLQKEGSDEELEIKFM